MLTSAYNILALFEAAFDDVGSAAALMVIDCTGKTHWAEGTEDGRTWRIEAQMVQQTPIDPEELRRAYGHMGRHLFLAFHKAVERKVHELGWRDMEALAKVDETLGPVLRAMDFHMGMAVAKGWLQESYHLEYSGGVRTQEPSFTIEQVFRWSQLDRPGRWSSEQLMEMFLAMDGGECYLNQAKGDAWVQAHPVELRGIVREILDTSFALSEGVHCEVVDARKAALAWERWWAAMPAQPLEKSVAVGAGQGESKCYAMVAGWYKRASVSSKLAKTCLPRMQEPMHGFPREKQWFCFQRSLRNAVQTYPNLVWKDRQIQAWLVHKAFDDGLPVPAHPAFKDNGAHDYIVLQTALDGDAGVHSFYPLWAAMQNTSTPTLDGDSVRELFSVLS